MTVTDVAAPPALPDALPAPPVLSADDIAGASQAPMGGGYAAREAARHTRPHYHTHHHGR